MVNVNKKYVKIAVGGLAVSTLVIGLSVGLTAKNKNNSNVSASNAVEKYVDFDENAAEKCRREPKSHNTYFPTPSSSTPELASSVTDNPTPSPSFETDTPTAFATDVPTVIFSTVPPTVSNVPSRIPTAKPTRLAKSSKVTKAGKIKAGKTKSSKQLTDPICVTLADQCNGATPENYDNAEPSKLGGKSGGRRKLYGKSGGITDGKIYCGEEIGNNPSIGGKFGARRKLTGKFGGSSDVIVGDNVSCVSRPPSICETSSPTTPFDTTAAPTPKYTKTPQVPATKPPTPFLVTPVITNPAPTEPCDCSVKQWISFNGQCYPGCGYSCETLPSLFDALTSTCNEGFEDSKSCCDYLGLSAGNGGCIAVDLCPPEIPAETPAPTQMLTTGSTPTVSADVTGPPTTKDRLTTTVPEPVRA